MGKSTINGPCSIAFCMFTRPGHHLSRPPKGQSPKPSPKAYLRTQESSHWWNHPGKSPSVVVPSLVMVGLWHWHGIGLYWVYRISISTYISTYINRYQPISLLELHQPGGEKNKNKTHTSQFGIVIPTLWEHETSFGSVHNYFRTGQMVEGLV